MIAIIDYNAGNTASVKNALERLGYKTLITHNEAELKAADKVIFPGVGEASSAMRFLKEKALDKIIVSLQQPVLGICLGMQLMGAHSEEGNATGLGIFPVQVKRFPATDIVPHMGWNSLTNLKSDLFQGVQKNEDVYFVHSYYVEENPFSIADAEYILPFCAAMQKENFYAVQFHPEKSATVGEKILNNFLKL